MPITVFYTAKGGQGCTVTAAAYALAQCDHAAEQTELPSVLIDATGSFDLTAVLGMPEPQERGGYAEINSNLRLYHSPEDPYGLADCLDADGYAVIVDAGCVPTDHDLRDTFRILVTSNCYIALRRALALNESPDAFVLIDEPGRALNERDVAEVLGVERFCKPVPRDPAIARAVDSGLLAQRLPRYFDPFRLEPVQ